MSRSGPSTTLVRIRGSRSTRIIGVFLAGVALAAASLLHAPAALASWGIGGVQFGAFTEDGDEFDIEMRNVYGSDGVQTITGAVGTRSSTWAPGGDGVPDMYPLPSSFFIDASRFCPPEESFAHSLAITDPSDPGFWGGAGGPCWSYVFNPAVSKPGPWGYAVPTTADGPGGADLVFDRWEVTGADTSQCYTGDAGRLYDTLPGANGVATSIVGYKGYVDVFNADASKRGDYFAKAIYAPLSPDTSPPTIRLRPDLECAQLAKGSSFAATYNCVDPGDVDPTPACDGDVPNGSPVDTSTVGPHTFSVTATDSSGNQRTRTVSYTVVPTTPGLAVSDVSALEGNAGTSTATFTVSLDSATENAVTVDYATATGTATAADFTAAIGTLTFLPGDVSKSIAVSVIGENNFEDDETYSVQLSNPVNATIDTAVGTGTITNDDSAPTASIESVTSVTEGNSGTSNLLFHVSLSAPLERGGYFFTRDIVGGTATASVDYTPFLNNEPGIIGAFTFDSNGKAVIAVPILGDTTVEPDETVELRISSSVVPVPGAPAPIVVTNATSVGTIVNDDGPPPSWFTGFTSPVDAPPMVNSLKAGQAVPIKFGVGGDRGLNIFTAGSPSTQRVSCQTSAPLDVLEETSTAGASGLTYDPSTQLYKYTWKTAKSWAGTCRTVTLSFVDGTSKTVNFQLK